MGEGSEEVLVPCLGTRLQDVYPCLSSSKGYIEDVVVVPLRKLSPAGGHQALWVWLLGNFNAQCQQRIEKAGPELVARLARGLAVAVTVSGACRGWRREVEASCIFSVSCYLW